MNLQPLRQMAELHLNEENPRIYKLAEALLRALDALELCKQQRDEWFFLYSGINMEEEKAIDKEDQELANILEGRDDLA